MSLNQVVISSWDAILGSHTKSELIEAAFNDVDISSPHPPELSMLQDAIRSVKPIQTYP